MKKYIAIICIALCYIWACTPENPDMNYASVQDEGVIKVYHMAGDNAYMFVNGLRGKVLPPTWDLGNGQTAVGDTVYTGYAFADTYTVTMTYFDGVKNNQVSKEIKVTQDNMSLVSDPVYDYLTGGVEAIEGKTWVLDSLRTGHIRLWKRQTGQESDTKRAPMHYAGTGMYDDEITFKLLGAECFYENNGTSYSHGDAIDGIENYRINELKSIGAVGQFYKSTVAGDYIVHYTPNQYPQKWSLLKDEDEDKYYLTLSGGAYMFFYRGGAPNISYRIDSIGENYLRLVYLETSPESRANARWETHYLLVPKGYPIQPEGPGEEVEAKVDSIDETFEGGSSSVTFVLSGIEDKNNAWEMETYSIVRNVSMTGINPSNDIVRFVRGYGHDEQLQINRSYKIDLEKKNKLKMHVYLPTTNNYQDVNLKPTVEVRLVNSSNTSEMISVTHTVASSDLGKWVELEFDFSDSAEIKTFDRWVIQFGGQYPNGTKASSGIFYFDNLHLVE